MVAAKALVLEQLGQPPKLETVNVLDPAAGEVRVRMVASGVCATDQHVIRGHSQIPLFPLVLGHEGAGIIEAVGAGVRSLQIGDHVVISRTVACGQCRECLRGLPEDCNGPTFTDSFFGIMPDGRTRVELSGEVIYPLFGGTHSEFMTLRSEQVVKIDKDLPLNLFCLAGCAVATGVGAVLNIANVSPGDSVVVMGCGGVGLSVVQGARIAGATTVIAVDTVDEKIQLAQTLGATHAIDGSSDVASEITTIVPGGVDFAFEVVGSSALVAACISYTRIGGTTVMVGVPPAGSSIEIPGLTLLDDRRVIGCRGGSFVPSRDIPRLVRFYRAGWLNLAALLDRAVPLDEVYEALERAEDPTALRTVLTFER